MQVNILFMLCWVKWWFSRKVVSWFALFQTLDNRPLNNPENFSSPVPRVNILWQFFHRPFVWFSDKFKCLVRVFSCFYLLTQAGYLGSSSAGVGLQHYRLCPISGSEVWIQTHSNTHPLEPSRAMPKLLHWIKGTQLAPRT